MEYSNGMQFWVCNPYKTLLWLKYKKIDLEIYSLWMNAPMWLRTLPSVWFPDSSMAYLLLLWPLWVMLLAYVMRCSIIVSWPLGNVPSCITMLCSLMCRGALTLSLWIECIVHVTLKWCWFCWRLLWPNTQWKWFSILINYIPNWQ